MWAALLAGLLLKAKNQKDYERRLRSANTERARRREEVNTESRAKIMEELQQFAPEKRQAAQTEAQQGIEKRLSKDLMDALKQDEIDGSILNVNEVALQDRAARMRDSANKASALASILSRYRAPLDTMRDEMTTSANYALSRRDIAEKGRGMDVVDRNWISAIRPNPMQDFIGSALMAYGTYGLASEGMTGKDNFFKRGLKSQSVL